MTLGKQTIYVVENEKIVKKRIRYTDWVPKLSGSTVEELIDVFNKELNDQVAWFQRRIDKLEERRVKINNQAINWTAEG